MEQRKQNYLTGAATLSIAIIVVKVIGMLYKIPLKHLIDDASFGYFNTAYDIYSALLVVASTGLPVALSRMISEAQALGRTRQVQRIFRTALVAYISVGMLGSGLMMLFPKWLAGTVMHNPNAFYAIAVLGPSVLFICIASACRGYFQGHGDMRPTAVSQIIEAASKLVLGLLFAWLVIRSTTDGALAAGATIGGVTVGSLLSAVYLTVRYRRNRNRRAPLTGEADSFGATAKRLVSIALPITLGAMSLQLINLLDSSTLMGRIVSAAEQTPEGAHNIVGTLLAIARQNPPTLEPGQTLTHAVLSQHAADTAKGIYNFAQTIFNFPIAFIPCITSAIIPAISANLAVRDESGVRKVQNSSMRLMSLIALPCAVGLFVLAEPIMAILGGYGGTKLELASLLMALLAPTVVVSSITTMLIAMLQAHDHMVIPVINTLIGSTLKIVVNYILVGNPNIAILGGPISTFLCLTVVMILDLIAIHRLLRQPPKLLAPLCRAGLASVLMGAAAWLCYYGLRHFGMGTTLSFGAALLLAVALYAVLAIRLRVILREDCLLLPKGEKLAKLLHIRA